MCNCPAYASLVYTCVCVLTFGAWRLAVLRRSASAGLNSLCCQTANWAQGAPCRQSTKQVPSQADTRTDLTVSFSCGAQQQCWIPVNVRRAAA